MVLERHPLSPRMTHTPESLPRQAYLSEDWFNRELAGVFAKQWICAGRVSDFEANTMRRVNVGAASVIVCNTGSPLAAYHNVCRHRGSELCGHDSKELGKLITCPYHAWAYAAADGRLVSTAHAKPTPDFDKSAHGLLSVATRQWNGFLFLNAGAEPGAIGSDVPLSTLDNWPMRELVTGHRWVKELSCNWKVFWENYSECLHCPGIHPELCDLVPIYRTGVMGPTEALDWTPEQTPQRNLKPGADTWTLTGKPCGPVFPELAESERQAGYTFVTLWPSLYVVAHVDYVRAVRLEPLSPECTRLTAEWYFSRETLAQPGFDAGEVAGFAKIVLGQDGAAAEMNQRGLRSPAFTRGRLMPEEYEIHRFHAWVTQQMEEQK